MRTKLKDIYVRAVDLEAQGVSIAFVTTDDEEVKAEAKRNARLIAASTDLLDALKEVFVIGDTLVSDVYGYEFKEKARAAIAKATGEQV